MRQHAEIAVSDDVATAEVVLLVAAVAARLGMTPQAEVEIASVGATAEVLLLVAAVAALSADRTSEILGAG